MCKRHDQPFVLFDEVSEVPICMACCSQPPHVNHSRCDLVDAARDIRYGLWVGIATPLTRCVERHALCSDLLYVCVFRRSVDLTLQHASRLCRQLVEVR